MGVLEVRMDSILDYEGGRWEGAPGLEMVGMTANRVPLYHFKDKEPINIICKAVRGALQEATRDPSTIPAART